MPAQRTKTAKHYDPWAAVDPARPAAADWMRVVAIGGVGWFHIWQQSWVGGGALDHWPRSGAALVDVLVLLSAFCLFLPYANAAVQRAPLPPWAPLPFYRRRAVRIVPGYYVSLLASLGIALAWHDAGRQRGALAADLAAHLTFAQMLVPQAYPHTRLNGVTWTLTVFALFYLLFPFLARAACRAPVRTLAALLAVQAGWTLWLLPQYGTARYDALFNQFPAFCGVFAVGFAAAWALAWAARRPALQKKPVRVLCTLLGLAAFAGLDRLLRLQSGAAEYRRFQLIDRLPLVLAAAACTVLLALGVTLPLRRLGRGLAGISYSFYLWHQMLTVWLKYDLHLPAWVGETPPNQLGDTAWMHRANALYWAVSLAAAVFFTYAVERPAARLLRKKSLTRPPNGAML